MEVESLSTSRDTQLLFQSETVSGPQPDGQNVTSEYQSNTVTKIVDDNTSSNVNNPCKDGSQNQNYGNGASSTAESNSVANTEQVNLIGTTADESMAVEALSQLGGMFNMSDVHELTDTEFADLSPLCETCGMQFRSAYELQNHTPVCQALSTEVHVCNVCGENFERKIDLSNHIASHQPAEKLHTCRICSSVFSRKSDLTNHMSSHQTIRPHQCPECGVDFQRPSSLTNHMKIHKYHPGRSMMTLPYIQTKRVSNIFKSNISTDPMQEFLSFTSNDDTIPPAVFHETIDQQERNQTGVNLSLGLPSYESWNTRGSHSDNLGNGSNSNHTSYQVNVPFVPQLDSAQDLEQFNYFQDMMECTTIDVETTAMVSNIVESDADLIQKMKNDNTDSSLNFNANKFDNAAVKVEAVPFFLPGENDNAENIYSIDKLSEKAAFTGSHQCNECGVTFTRLKALQAHVLKHADIWAQRPFECHRCSEPFNDSDGLKLHLQFCTFGGNAPIPSNVESRAVQAKSGKHPCSSCDKRFTTKQKLFRHMWIHRKKHYVCEVCSLSLNTQEALDSHRRSVHPGDPPFVCQTCGKSFASRQGVWEHRRVHGTNKVSLFWCHECNKSFSSRQGYLIHTRTHTGERPYGCRFCMKAFRDGGTLRKHERIHTGERPHVCPLCYRAFNQKVVLREHVRWVHAANRSGVDNDKEHVYLCQVCDHTLGDREELCAHIVKHSDDLAKAAKKKEHPVAPQVNSSSLIKRNLVNNKVNLKKKKKKKITPDSSTIDDPLLILDESHRTTKNHTKHLSYQLEVAATEIKKEHICGMCDETFIDKVQLMDHVQIHI